MHLRSKRIVLQPKLHCLSTSSSSRSPNVSKARFPSDLQATSPPFVLPQRFEKIPADGTPSTVVRMMKTSDADATCNLASFPTVDSTSSAGFHNSKRVRNFRSEGAADGSRKIRLKPIGKPRKKIISEKKRLWHQNNISTNDWPRSRRCTRLHVRTQESSRYGGSKEESIGCSQKEDHDEAEHVELVDAKTTRFVSVSKGVTTRYKAGRIPDERITSGVRRTSARSKVGTSNSSIEIENLRFPLVLRSGKVANKVQCRPLNSILIQNKVNVISTTSNGKLRGNKKEGFNDVENKACLSQKFFHSAKKVGDSDQHDLRRANMSESATSIGDPVHRKKWETNEQSTKIERNNSELSKSSKASGNNCLENSKGNKPRLLHRSKRKCDEQQRNTETTVVISTSRKRKRVSENLERKSRPESLASLNPSVESQLVDNETGAVDARFSDTNATVPDALHGNVFRNSKSAVKNVKETPEFVAGTSEDCSLSDLRNVKFEPAGKWCLLSAEPTETGGRQMRPRPLCLEQPLVVLVEDKDQDYFELDGGMFYQMLQQAELKTPCVDKRKISKKAPKISRDGTERTLQSISVPSFRSVMELKGTTYKSSPVYMLSKSYIKESPQVQYCIQAEYDIDEVDEEWLYQYNQSVPAPSSISVDQFEKIIDLLENTMSNSVDILSELLENSENGFKEYEECCICNGGENSADNLIHRCADCHILVHESCYGIQDSDIDLRKKNWRCRKCEAVAKGLEKSDISCVLCCQQGGALKRATEPHKWAHVTCALYTNETYFIDTDAMEPIEGLDAANARAKRQRRKCHLCGKKEGCMEKCSVQGCKETFHVSCGVTEGASFELLHSNEHVTAVLIYCPKHAAGMEMETARVSINKAGTGKGLNVENANGITETCIDGFNGEDGGNKKFVEGILLHWLSRRFEHGGPLLHHIQQEHASRQFNIFNPVDGDVSATSLSSQEKGVREMGFNEKFPMVWNWLSKIQDLSHLVVTRERFKHDLYLTELEIIEANIKALKANDTIRSCSACCKPRLSLICTICNKNTCFFCIKANGRSTWQSWQNSLKKPKYVCSDCQEQGRKAGMEAVSSSPTAQYHENDTVTGSRWNCSSADGNNCNNDIYRSNKKPCLLLPRIDSVHQDRQVTEAFWGGNPLKKTILVSDLLNGARDTSSSREQ